MDEFFETQMILASNKAEKADSAEAEQSVKLSQGQTPTIDADVYNPKAVRDAGYPLSNPTAEPNKHTKPGARMFGGRDASNGQPVIRPTTMPNTGKPQTSAFSTRMEPIYSGLAAAENAFTVETGISKAFEQMIKYTNSLSDMDPTVSGQEANRAKWATSDRLEAIGFEHVSNSERTSEGIDDKGLDGLQMMMSAQIMRGVGDFDSVTSAIGDTGANTEQLEETWNKAVDAYNRAAQGVIQGLPTDEASALQDPRYLSAAGIISDALGDRRQVGLAKDMDEQTLYRQGMFLVDMVKGNPLYLIAAVHEGKKNPMVADALNFLLDADEEMDTTWADFGRGVLGAALDPLSYVGVGLVGQAVKGAARTGAVRLALKQAGLVGAEGAILTGSYTGLMDYGFQNIDILSGRQEEFSISRSVKATGMGAGAGFVFGSALSGITTGASKLLNKWVQRRDGSVAAHPAYTNRYNVEDLPNQPDNIPASADFKDVPLPDNVVSPLELETRRRVKDMMDLPGLEAAINPPEGQSSASVGFVDVKDQAGNYHIDDAVEILNNLVETEIADEATKIIVEMIDSPEIFKGVNPEQIYDDVLSAIDVMVRNYKRSSPDIYSLDNRAWVAAYKAFKDDKTEFIKLIKEQRGLKVVKGGKATDAPNDPAHMAPMELIRNEQLIADQAKIDDFIVKIDEYDLSTPEGLEAYRKDFYTDVQRKILEANDIVQEHIDAGDFRFKIDDEIVSKASGKKYKIHHLIWDEKTSEPRYRVIGYDGTRYDMPEGGFVGGKPKLDIISAKEEFGNLTAAEEFEMAIIAMKHDDDLTMVHELSGKVKMSPKDEFKDITPQGSTENKRFTKDSKNVTMIDDFGKKTSKDGNMSDKPDLKLAPTPRGFNEKAIRDFAAQRAEPHNIKTEAADEIIDVVEDALRNVDETVSDKELQELLTDAVNDTIVDNPELAKEMESAIDSPEFIEYIKAVRREEMQDLTPSKLRKLEDTHAAIFDSGKPYADMEKDFTKLYESLDPEQFRYIMEDSPARLLTSPLFTKSLRAKLGEYKPGSGLYVDPKLIDSDQYLQGYSKLTSKRIAQLHEANKIPLDLDTLTSDDLGKLEIEDISELITNASSDKDKLKILDKMYADEYDQLEMPAKRDARRLGFFGDVLDEQLFTDTGEKVKPKLGLVDKEDPE